MADQVKNNAPAEEDDAQFITLEFEDGVEIECEILGIFEVEGKEYIALLPQDDSDDVYLYGYKEDEKADEFELIDILDDDEFNKVSEAFAAIEAEDE